jgi:hypothetical protein
MVGTVSHSAIEMTTPPPAVFQYFGVPLILQLMDVLLIRSGLGRQRRDADPALPTGFDNRQLGLWDHP